jgi:TP901 family phage tail tape measure protein
MGGEMTVGSILVMLRAEGRALDAGLSAGERRISGFARTAERTGRTMSRSLTLPILAATGASAKLALDFEHQMKLIGGLVGVSGKQLEVYKTKILDLGPALGKTPQELAESLYFITSSGFEGAAALRVLEASAKASAAGLGDTATVADAVTSAVNAYGEKSLSAARATDIMLAAVREGKAEPEALAKAIGTVIPSASQLGVSFDEVAAATAAMTLTGQDAFEATTALNQLLMNSLKPTKEGADALKEVGLSYAEVRESFDKAGLLPTIQMLDEAFGGNVETMAKVFGNVRSLRAVLALTGGAADKTAGIFRELARDGNDTAKAFEKMSKGEGFKLEQAWAELQTMMIEFGDVALPMIVELVDEGMQVVEWLDQLSPAAKETALKIALFAAALGPVLSMSAKMAPLFKGMVKGYKLLAGATATAAAAQEALNIAQGAGGKSKLTPGAQRGVDLVNKGARQALGMAPAAAAVPGGGAAGGGAAGGGTAAGVATGAATAAAASIALLIAPHVIAMALRNRSVRDVMNEEVTNAERAQEGVAAGGSFQGSSKGYGGGQAGAKADRGGTGVEIVQKMIMEIDTKGATDADADMAKLIEKRELLAKVLTDPITLGQIDGKHTVTQLQRIEEDMMERLGIGKKKADKIMGMLFKEWNPSAVLNPKINKAAAAAEKRLDVLRARAAKQIKFGNPNATALINEISRVSAMFDDMAGAARNAADQAANALRRSQGGTGGGVFEGKVGGLAMGPTTGFPATLHGIELVLPVSDPRRTADLMEQYAALLPRGSGLTAAGFDDGGGSSVPRASRGGAAVAAGGDTYEFKGCLFAQDFDRVIAEANKRGSVKVNGARVGMKGRRQ